MTAAPLEVVAAVLECAGRVLVAQRPDGKEDAGLWEFPGGKRNPGEPPLQALARELREELSIELHSAAPLIRVPVQRPSGRLWLDTWRVTDWRGEPAALEHAALAWVDPAELADWHMPMADRPVVSALVDPAAYAITPDTGDDPDAFLHGLDGLLASGVTRVQLRLPSLDTAQRHARVGEALERFGRGIDWLVNGDADVAEAFGIGLHLRAADLRVLAARPFPRNPARSLGASCHDEAELALAQALRCDFAVLGPVAPTPSHPGQAGMGWEAFSDLKAGVSLPVYALGGVGPADLATARRWGAQGVAGIRGWWRQPAAASAR